jgi:hypothetical protein
MKQGSKEWFNARIGKVTGSRVGAILGKSRYRTRDNVMREMVREHFGADKEFTGNIATEWGNDHEDIARQDAIIEIGNKIGEEVYCVESGFKTDEDFDGRSTGYIGASPDGLIGKVNDTEDAEMIAGLEIKCPFSRRINVTPPDDHWHQVQCCMYVYNLKWWWYYQWTPERTQLIIIPKDEEWIDKYGEKIDHFWSDYRSIIEDKDYASDYLTDKTLHIESEEWAGFVNDYLCAKSEHEFRTTQLEIAKARLIEVARAKNVSMCYGSGASVTRVIKKGSIKYGNVDEIKGLDLEKYRGEDSVYFRVGEKK